MGNVSHSNLLNTSYRPGMSLQDEIAIFRNVGNEPTGERSVTRKKDKSKKNIDQAMKVGQSSGIAEKSASLRVKEIQRLKHCAETSNLNYASCIRRDSCVATKVNETDITGLNEETNMTSGSMGLVVGQKKKKKRKITLESDLHKCTGVDKPGKWVRSDVVEHSEKSVIVEGNFNRKKDFTTDRTHQKGKLGETSGKVKTSLSLRSRQKMILRKCAESSSERCCGRKAINSERSDIVVGKDSASRRLDIISDKSLKKKRKSSEVVFGDMTVAENAEKRLKFW